jgi:predicted DsbA family dithiol-disulfide isomerase
MKVAVWADIACPWRYVGRARFNRGLAAFSRHDQVEVVHRSYELNPQAQNGNVPIIDAVAAQYGRTHEQQVAREEQAASMATSMGLGFRIGGRVFGNTFDAHRLIHFARTRGVQDRLLNLAFRANFAEKRSIYDRQTLLDVAVKAGPGAQEALRVIDDPEAYAAQVRADERLASELGASGVPFFVLSRRYGISGVQSVETFTRALDQAWTEQTAA